ncbi:hypothetical protein GCM10025868_14680 [Angustibacter aerolatus]|uniref:Glycosyl transferase family 1 domain-containing protein n=1 Tax=Angustibacter aerolatus TaxID=1162965 RepID=A0ABQ6JDJ1_9ACTN|nr:hypothetical protein GCM10025868_14680 [Angustibacter aerolatus]
MFLSLDEGFGIPPLEALHFGAPVLAADIAVLHETLGDDAHFADPRDVPSIAAGVRAGLDAPRTEGPVDRGFSWDATVDGLRAAAAQVADRPRRGTERARRSRQHAAGG